MTTLSNFIELYSVAYGFHAEYFRASDWPAMRLDELYYVIRFLHAKALSVQLVSSTAAAGIETVVLIDRVATQDNERYTRLFRRMEEITVGEVAKLETNTTPVASMAADSVAHMIKALHRAQNVHNHRCLHPMHKRVIAGTHLVDGAMSDGHMLIPFSLSHGAVDDMRHGMMSDKAVAECRRHTHRAIVHEFVGRIDPRVTPAGDGKTPNAVSDERDYRANTGKTQEMLAFYGRVARSLAAEPDHKAFSPLVLTSQAKHAFDEMFEVLAVNASAAGVSPSEMQQAKRMVQQIMDHDGSDPDVFVARNVSPLLVMAYAAHLHVAANGLVGVPPAWRMLAQLYTVVRCSKVVWSADGPPPLTCSQNSALAALDAQLRNCCLFRPVHALDNAVTIAYGNERHQAEKQMRMPIVIGAQQTSLGGNNMSILEVIWSTVRTRDYQADIVTQACVAGIMHGASFCATMYAAPESGPRDLLVATSHLDHALFSLCGLLGYSTNAMPLEDVGRRPKHTLSEVYVQAVLLELARISLVLTWPVDGTAPAKKPAIRTCLKEALRTSRLTIFDLFRLAHAPHSPIQTDVILHYGLLDQAYASLFDALSPQGHYCADVWNSVQREAGVLFYEYLQMLEERCNEAIAGEPDADAFEYAVLLHTLAMAAAFAVADNTVWTNYKNKPHADLPLMIERMEEIMTNPQLVEMHHNQKVRVMDVRFALQRSAAFGALPFAVTLNYDTAFVGGGNNTGAANGGVGLRGARTTFVSSHASQLVALLFLESRLWSIRKDTLGEWTVTRRMGDTLMPIAGAAKTAWCPGRVPCSNGPLCTGSTTETAAGGGGASRHHHDFGSMVHAFRSRGGAVEDVAAPHDLHAALYTPSRVFADPTVAGSVQYHPHDLGQLRPFLAASTHSDAAVRIFGHTYMPSITDAVYDAMHGTSAITGAPTRETSPVFSTTPQKHAGQLKSDVREVLCRIQARDVETTEVACESRLATTLQNDGSSSDGEDDYDFVEQIPPAKQSALYVGAQRGVWPVSSHSRHLLSMESLLLENPAHMTLFKSTRRLISSAYRQHDASSYTTFNSWLYKAFGFELSRPMTNAAGFGGANLQSSDSADVMLIPDSFIDEHLVIVLPNQAMELLSGMLHTEADREYFVRAHVFRRAQPPKRSASPVDPPLFLVDAVGNIVPSLELVRIGVVPRVDNLLEMTFLGRGIIPGFAAMPTALVGAICMDDQHPGGEPDDIDCEF